MRFKRLIFWSHLISGVAVSLVVLSLSVTGTLLAFEEQIKDFAIRNYRTTGIAASRLDIDQLAQISLQATNGRATRLIISKNPALPVAASAGRSGNTYIDPYSGAVLGGESKPVEAFFGYITRFHRWFALEGESRNFGRNIIGASNLAFLFLLVSGIYLWWPKSWHWKRVRYSILFRKNLPNAKARDYSWHRVLGFWTLVPLLLIIVSGVVISYPWASNLVYSVFGEEPTRGGRPFRGGASSSDLYIAEGGRGLQNLFEQATTYDSGWKTLTLSIPKSSATMQVTFDLDTGNGYQSTTRTQLTFDQMSGDLITTSGPEALTPGRKARSFMRFVHTGQVFGFLGQLIAALSSIAVTVMIYTGLALAYRRLIQPIFRKKFRKT